MRKLTVYAAKYSIKRSKKRFPGIEGSEQLEKIDKSRAVEWMTDIWSFFPNPAMPSRMSPPYKTKYTPLLSQTTFDFFPDYRKTRLVRISVQVFNSSLSSGAMYYFLSLSSTFFLIWRKSAL